MRRQFALELLVDFNVNEAWHRAHKALGTKPPAKRSGGAWVAMKDPAIAQMMTQLRAEAMNRAGINVERTEREIARLAYVDIAAFYDDRNCLRNIHDIPPEHRAAIVKIETDELFDFSDEGDVRRRLDSLELAATTLLATANSMKPGELGALAVGVAALRGAMKPAKPGDKRPKYLIGYTKKISIADKKGALELAGRRDGIFKDKVLHDVGETLEKIIADSYKVPA